MFGIEIPTIITDACTEAGGRGYLYNNQGKLAFSPNVVDKTVAIIQTNVTDMTVPDDIRTEMNNNNFVYTAIGADNPNNSKSFLPDRYLERINYENRVYIYGVTDCFTLIRDYFKDNYNIFLPSNIDRSFGWWFMGRDLYLDNFSNYGFHETRDYIKKDDVLLFRFDTGAPSHSAIYMGEGMMLHHMLGRFSCIEPYDGAYKMNLVGVLRYGQ